MIYLILALILSSLALVFAFVSLVFIIISGKRITTVFVQMKDKLNEVSTSFACIISQNNVDHDRFKQAIKEHHETLNIHARRLNEHEKQLQPRVITLKKKSDEPAE